MLEINIINIDYNIDIIICKYNLYLNGWIRSLENEQLK